MTKAIEQELADYLELVRTGEATAEDAANLQALEDAAYAEWLEARLKEIAPCRMKHGGDR